MSLLVLSAADVEAVTQTFTPEELQALMAQVFYCLSEPSSGQETSIHTPHRTKIPMPEHTALFMPARVAKSFFAGTSLKVVCVPSRSDDTRGLPASTIVMNEETGSVKALVNARSLTALRNAAGSLLSSNIVGLHEPKSIVVFGAGKQIEAHLDLHLRYYPSITSCTVVNRSLNARVTDLNARLSPRFPHVTFTYIASSEVSNETSSDATPSLQDQLKSVVQSAQLIICATSSTAPLFPSSWVRNGTHVILIGSYTPHMLEVDRQLVQRAIRSGWKKDWAERSTSTGADLIKANTANSSSDHTNIAPGPSPHIPQILIVDSREACAIEAGELINAGIADDAEQVAEIGELVYLNGSGGIELKVDQRANVDARRDLDGFDGPITVFKSVGVGLQDVAIACAVVQKAEQMGMGVNIQDYDA